jgi:RNA polymerase sigma factor (sigma-70 family)
MRSGDLSEPRGRSDERGVSPILAGSSARVSGADAPSGQASADQRATVDRHRDVRNEIAEEAAFEASSSLAHKAARIRTSIALRRRTGLHVDREDLEQEGAVACWRALPQFDPTRASLPTFFDRVAGNRIASVIKSSRTPVMLSLDEADACTVGMGTGHIYLKVDVGRVLERLSEDERRLAQALMKYSPSEAGRRLQISSSTVYARMAKLRPLFVAAGIDANYFRGSRP